MKPMHILLVEDSPADVRLLHEAFRTAGRAYQLTVVEDGEAALNYLQGLDDLDDPRSSSETPPPPALVLLDLNLPRKNGLEVLAALKGDARLRSLPVVVFTTSERDSDVAQSYALQANGYIHKPTHIDEFVRIVRSLSDFWFNIVTLPPPAAPRSQSTPLPEAAP